MLAYMFSVGQPEVTVGIVSLEEAKRLGLKQTPGGKKNIEPGDTFVTNAGNCPTIIATAGPNMMVSHIKRTSVKATVTAIVKALNQKVPGDKIVMCMQFGDAELESKFVQQIHCGGIWHSWTGLSINDFPDLVRAREDHLIMIKHNN